MTATNKMLTPLDDLHQKAMELADLAFFANRKGNKEEAKTYYKEAFEFEKAAAMLIVNNYELEPTRSVFFRSAASLILSYPTLDYQEYREAEKMIAFGLTGNPPLEIAEELRSVLLLLEEKWQQSLLEKTTAFKAIGQFLAINLNTNKFEFISIEQQKVKGSFVESINSQVQQLSFSLHYVISGIMAQNPTGWYGIIDNIEVNQ